jgi:hypothetical protein
VSNKASPVHSHLNLSALAGSHLESDNWLKIQGESLMKADSRNEAAILALRRINRVWLDRQVEALVPMVDPEITMVFPEFTGRIRGREQFLAGFRDFCENAKVHEFHDEDYESDVIANTAVVSFRYDMVYERSDERYRASGRDLWVFRNQDNNWIAVWRMMVDMREQPA